MEGIVNVTGGFTLCLVLADGLIKPEAKKMRYKSNVRLNRGKPGDLDHRWTPKTLLSVNGYIFVWPIYNILSNIFAKSN